MLASCASMPPTASRRRFAGRRWLRVARGDDKRCQDAADRPMHHGRFACCCWVGVSLASSRPPDPRRRMALPHWCGTSCRVLVLGGWEGEGVGAVKVRFQTVAQTDLGPVSAAACKLTPALSPSLGSRGKGEPAGARGRVCCARQVQRRIWQGWSRQGCGGRIMLLLAPDHPPPSFAAHPIRCRAPPSFGGLCVVVRGGGEERRERKREWRGGGDGQKGDSLDGQKGDSCWTTLNRAPPPFHPTPTPLSRRCHCLEKARHSA